MSTVFLTELKLLLRHWSVWVVAACAAIMAYDVGAHNAMADLPFWLDESFFRFYLLAVLLLTIGVARRSAADRVDELVEAMPYRPAAWVAGRLLASFAVWLGVSLLGWVTAAATLALRGEGINYATLALHWVVAAPISVAIAVAVGFALGYLPGNGILGYVLGLGYFFCATMLPMLTERNNTHRGWLFADMLAPQHWLRLTEPFGYFPNARLVLLNRLFNLGLGAAICALVVALLARRRKVPAWRPAAALAISLAVVLVGVVGTQSVFAERSRTVTNEAAVWVRRQVPQEPPVASRLRTDNYNLNVSFAPKTHGLGVTGSFDVANTADRAVEQLQFTLRSSFWVQAVAGPDGNPLPFRQGIDDLVVQANLQPGATIRLTMRWGGTVWQWRDAQRGDYWGQTLGAHVAPESIFLPATYGWYPLPIRAALTTAIGDRCAGTRCEPDLRDPVLPVLPPASFTVATKGTDLTVITNAGSPTTGLYLVGTPLPTYVSGGAELTVAPENRAHALEALAQLQKRADLLGLTVAGRMIEVPTASAYGRWRATEAAETPGVILMRSLDIAQPEGGGDLPSMRWWSDRKGDAELAWGLASYMEWAVTGQDPNVPGGVPRWVCDTMRKLDEVRGREAAVAALRDAYQEPTRERFITAVAAASEGDVRVAKALAPLLDAGGQKR